MKTARDGKILSHFSKAKKGSKKPKKLWISCKCLSMIDVMYTKYLSLISNLGSPIPAVSPLQSTVFPLGYSSSPSSDSYEGIS